MYVFGDSFDPYATTADAVLGYWDSGVFSAFALGAGRFAGGRCLFTNSTGSLIKSSGANDAVHHIVCAVQQTAALTGTTLAHYLQLGDGATGQCCIVFRSDGAILLTSGGPGGTVLATYAGAVSAQNTWFAFEFEVVINNATGSFSARKNGNTSNDFTLGSLNTRGGTANNYANRLTLGVNAYMSDQRIDDLLWRSDTASVPWVGDVRCYTRMPASDASVVFSKSSPVISSYASTATSGTSAGSASTGYVYMVFITPTFSGSATTLGCNLASAFTGHINMALYDASGTGGGPGVLLGQCTPLTNPAAGITNHILTAPVNLTKGTVYWVAILADGTPSIFGSNSTAYQYSANTYAAGFPGVIGATTASNISGLSYSGVVVLNVSSVALVNEAQQDGAATYVYSANPGDGDLYGIAALAVTPTNTVAVTTRGFVSKSDAGARSGAVQIKSGASTVDTGSVALGTSFGWMYRTDVTDPATGAAWTATGVNSATIGPKVTA